jgi:predicted nucleotidyltransferase
MDSLKELPGGAASATKADHTRLVVSEQDAAQRTARGDQHEGSDVDILVDIDPSIGLRFVSLAEELEGLLGEPVELVSSRAVGPRMKLVIEADCVEVA